MPRVVTTLTVSALLCATPAAGQSLGAVQTAEIDAIFADFTEPGAPGAAAAVIRNGEIVYSKGFGLAQLEYGIPVEPTTVFHVASVSKQFTAMAVLLLVEEGRIDLDADLRSYLDWVPDLGAVITPRQILSHTSGVRDQWELLYTAGWRLDDVITKADVRRLMTKQRGLNFEPGSEYLYSNMGYSLAAELVQEVSGMPFDEFVKARILDPLGMERTHVHDDHEHIVPERAYSYRATEDGYRNAVLSFANHGATSLFTTAEDLVRWLDNFRTGEVGGAMRGEMVRRTRLNDGERIGYALGVFQDRYRGRRRVQHGGADAGFRSRVDYYPDDGVGIAVVTNLASGDPSRRARQIADVVLASVLEPVEVEAQPATPDEVQAVSVARETLERYEGTYTTRMVNITVEVRGDELWLASPNEVRLIPTSDTSFVADDAAAATLDFVVEEGSVSRLLVAQGELRLEGEPMEVGSAFDAADYLGTYYSPEIETLYEVRGAEGGIELYNLRRGELPLEHRTADIFAGPQFFVQGVTFVRNDAGAVTEFLMSGSRVRNHRFVRLETPLPGR